MNLNHVSRFSKYMPLLTGGIFL